MSPSNIATAAILVALLLQPCPAQDASEAKQPDSDEAVQKQISDYWIKVSREHAKTYSIAPTNKPKNLYRLSERAVFQHIQTVRGNDVGGVHLWIDERDRPAAIATVFAWTTGNTTRMMFNEFHSMSDEPITTLQAKEPLWESKKAGTQWATIPNGPKPKASPRLRRLQAKVIAKRFSSHTIDRNRKRFELRRVSSPIYEYDIKDDDTRGGGVFAFCQSTDIETMLWLEVRLHEGQPRWEYTCVKFTDYEPHMIYEQKDVWQPFDDEYLRNGDPHFWAPIGTRKMPQVEKDFRQ